MSRRFIFVGFFIILAIFSLFLNGSIKSELTNENGELIIQYQKLEVTDLHVENISNKFIYVKVSFDNFSEKDYIFFTFFVKLRFIAVNFLEFYKIHFCYA